MPDKYDEEKRMAKEAQKQEKLEDQRIKTTKEIIKNLEEQKRIEKEHLDLVEQHQHYWKNQMKNTNRDDRERYDDLEKKLKGEDKIYDEIIGHIKQLDKEIESYKEHIP